MRGGTNHLPASRTEDAPRGRDSAVNGLPSVVFPLPGGRNIVAPAWVALTPARAASSDPQGSTADRRRTMARRLSHPGVPDVYGEEADTPLVPQSLDADPTYPPSSSEGSGL
jgi:hypothetical protein